MFQMQCALVTWGIVGRRLRFEVAQQGGFFCLSVAGLEVRPAVEVKSVLLLEDLIANLELIWPLPTI